METIARVEEATLWCAMAATREDTSRPIVQREMWPSAETATSQDTALLTAIVQRENKCVLWMKHKRKRRRRANDC